MAFIKKKDFKETCIFQEWVPWEEYNSHVTDVPRIIYEDLKGKEKPGKVVCVLRRKVDKPDCIRGKCLLHQNSKKLEKLEEVLNKLKEQIKDIENKKSVK